MATTKETKVAFLSRYGQIKERMLILLERKKAYQDDIYTIKAVSYSDDKTGSTNKKSDLSDKVVRYMNVTTDIDAELEELARRANYIKSTIHKLNNYKLLSVLELRYIDGLYVKEIAEVMGVSQAQNVSKTIARAIQVLPVTEDDLKKVL